VKPRPFVYESPQSEEEALTLLAEHGDDAKILAGGQSLIPLLNLRLASPSVLVDVNRIASLDRVERRHGRLWIGATARQRHVETSPLAQREAPLLVAALHWVAHTQIRNRGTVGGSVSHADPAAELPVAMACLDAVMHVRGPRGARAVAARDFFHGFLTTALESDEMLVGIEVPAQPQRCGAAFVEFARRRGDFAIGGAAARVWLSADGRCAGAALALLGASDAPVRATDAEAVLVGRRIDADAVADVSARVATTINPTGTASAGAEYRRSLIAKLAGQAVTDAAAGVLPR
jgi:CO/xanthine dehydrogenase FAD-binding subunit